MFLWLFLCVDSGWVFIFVFDRLILSLLFLFCFFCPCGERGVGGCNFGFGGRFGRCVFTELFSIVTVPEIHWLLSDLLAFSDNNDICFYRSAFGRMTPSFPLGFCGCFMISRIQRNLFIHKARIPARRFSSSISQHFKMFPPFASNEGYTASGLRYESDGA